MAAALTIDLEAALLKGPDDALRLRCGEFVQIQDACFMRSN